MAIRSMSWFAVCVFWSSFEKNSCLFEENVSRYELSKFEGESLELKCDRYSKEVKDFSWTFRRDNRNIRIYDAIEGFRSLWDRSFSLNHTNLLCHNLTTDLSGVYKCSDILNPAVISEIKVTIRASTPPSPCTVEPLECPTLVPVTCVCPTIQEATSPPTTSMVETTTTTMMMECEGECREDVMLCVTNNNTPGSVKCKRHNVTCSPEHVESMMVSEGGDWRQWVEVIEGGLLLMASITIVGLTVYIVRLKRIIESMKDRGQYQIPLQATDEDTHKYVLQTYDFIPDYDSNCEKYLRFPPNTKRELPDIPDYLDVIAS